MNGLYEQFNNWTRVINFSILGSVTEGLSLLYQQRDISPPRKDVFNAFKECPYDDLKVVMLGMDPYPQKGVATGLLFGNHKDTPIDKISPSLSTLIEGMKDPCHPQEAHKFDITMRLWASQGILLLNSALTVEVGRTGSHTRLWRPFISTLLGKLSITNPGLIYVLFGSQAQSFEQYIDPRNNTVIKCRHPAYYARSGEQPCYYKVLEEIDRILMDNNGYKIKWYEY